MRTISASKRAAATALITLFVLSCVPRVHARRHPNRITTKKRSVFSTSSMSDGCDRDAKTSARGGKRHSKERLRPTARRSGDARRSEWILRASADDSRNLLAGDIDRDGDIDLIWIGSGDRNYVVVWLNDGDGKFAEVADSSSYTSEFEDLFGNDPSNHKIKRGRKTTALASASLNTVGLPLVTRIETTTSSLVPVSLHQPLSEQTYFVLYLRKRGPPSIFS